jgi:hypothetical protein
VDTPGESRVRKYLYLWRSEGDCLLWSRVSLLLLSELKFNVYGEFGVYRR